MMILKTWTAFYYGNGKPTINHMSYIDRMLKGDMVENTLHVKDKWELNIIIEDRTWEDILGSY